MSNKCEKNLKFLLYSIRDILDLTIHGSSITRILKRSYVGLRDLMTSDNHILSML